MADSTRPVRLLARPRRIIRTLLAAGLLVGAGLSHAADVRVAASGLGFPEGPVFVGNVLYFVDYASSSVDRLVGGRVERFWHQDGCGANGLAAVPGGLLVACYDNGTVVRVSPERRVEETLHADDAGRPFDSPNDLAPDARGGVYFSGSGSASTLGKVYYRDASGRVRQVAANLHYANGVAVAPDGKTLYLAESEASRVLAFPIAADGSLGAPREFVQLADLLARTGERAFTPDGVRVDGSGNLFVGLYRGGGFAVVSPEAKLLAFVRLPGAHHANLALSPDRRTVFVTSADDASDGSSRGEVLAVPNPLAR